MRYADDFLVGVVGSKKMAVSIQKQINTFIKSNLHLKIKQNKIVNRNQGSVPFLGFRIYLAKFHKKLELNGINLLALLNIVNELLLAFKNPMQDLPKLQFLK